MQDDTNTPQQSTQQPSTGDPLPQNQAQNTALSTPVTQTTQTNQVYAQGPTQNITPTSVAPQTAAGSNSSNDKENEPKRESIGSIFSTIGILLLAPVIALLMIAFVFQSYQVDGPSMETTLQNNDRLIVWKAPRTWSKITGNQYVPNRGDVIVFNQSDLPDNGTGTTRQLIKRVIGMPGERVEVQNGVITVYNKDNPKGFQPDATLPYGANIPETAGDLSVTLGDDEIFVAGDNRPESLDSRTFGPIKTGQIVGKLVLRMLPASNVTLF